MYQIREIKIRGFRGIPTQDGLEVDFTSDLRNLVLFANNAKGKSSLADSIEFAFSGKLKSFDMMREESSARDLIHTHSSTGAVIEIKVIKDGNFYKDIKVELDSNGKLLHPIDVDLERVFREEIGLLNQDLLNEFLNESRYRRNEIFTSRALNLPTIHSFRQGLEVICRNFESDVKLGELKREHDLKINQLNTICAELTSLSTKLEKALQKLGVVEYSETELKSRLAILMQIDSAEVDLSPEFDWNSLLRKYVASSEFTAGVIKRSQESAQLESCHELGDDYLDALTAIGVKITLLQENKEQMGKAAFDELYKAAITVIPLSKEAHCPLCDQELTDEHFKLHDLISYLNQKRDEFGEYRKAVESIGTDLQIHRTYIDNVLKGWKNVYNCSALETNLDNLISNPTPESFKLYSVELACAAQEVNSVKIGIVQKRGSQVETADPNEAIRNQIMDIKGVYEAHEQYGTVETQVKTLRIQSQKLAESIALYNRILDALNSFKEEFKAKEAALNLDIINDISNDDGGGLTQIYFKRLYPEYDGVVPYIERGVSGLMLKCKFWGTEKQVRPIISEGQKRAFILSLWLANLKRAQRELGFLIMDDITTSLDQEHRLRLIELIEEEFPDLQKIFLTHDEFLYDYMQQLFASKRDRYLFKEIKTWSISTVVLDSDDLLQKANSYIISGDKSAAAVYLRQYLEQILLRACEKYKVPVKFVKNPRDRKLEDFYQALKNHVMATPGVVVTWPLSSHKETWVLNLVIHTLAPGTHEITAMNLAYVRDTIMEIESMFRCGNCSKSLSRLTESCSCVPVPAVGALP